MQRAPLEPSLWYATAAPPPPTSALEAEVETDVAIVGAGYTGLSTAIHLGQKGVRTVVLEAQEIGFGGSGRNAGHCTPTFHVFDLATVRRILGQPWAERLIARQTNAANLVFGLIRRYGIDCEAVQNGYIQAAHAPLAMRKMEKRCADYASVGKACRMLDRDEVRALSGSERFFGGWFHPEGGHLNPLGYARGLARAAIKEEAAMYTRSPVTAIAPRGTGWRVQTPKGAVHADKVVVGTGAYTEGVWAGLERSYSILGVMILASQPLGDNVRRVVLPRNTTLVDSRGDATVYKYNKEGRLVTSVFVERRRGRDVAYTKTLMANRLQFLHPELTGLDWQYYWYGDLDMQPRTFPRLFELAPGVVASLGYSGRGVPTGTMMGTVLADWASGTPAAELALPLEPLKRAPFFMGAVSRLALPYFRLRDGWASRQAGIAEPPF
jgi:glycine/D-amino acid oxidase-like deaminating enzyme